MASATSFLTINSVQTTIWLFIFGNTCAYMVQCRDGGPFPSSASLVYCNVHRQTSRTVSFQVDPVFLHGTNTSIGELEQTISTSFVKAANLRALLCKSKCPDAIKSCASYFEKLTDPQVRNTLLSNISSFAVHITSEPPPQPIDGRSTISELTYKALQLHFHPELPPHAAKTMRYFTMHGRTFSTFSHHRGNSAVLIRHSRGLCPAQIEDIIQTSPDQVLFAVRYYRTPIFDDPFKRYPVLQTSLWEAELGKLTCVDSKNVECHFASTTFDWMGKHCRAIISLSRV